MSARFFLDTNVFVSSFDRAAPAKARRATQLIREALAASRGVVSYQVVQEFSSVALRRFTPPLSVDQVSQYLKTTFRPLLAIPSSMALFLEALRLSDRHRLRWYDSLIVSAALQSQCEVLYSEDFEHGQRFGDLVVENPFRQA